MKDREEIIIIIIVVVLALLVSAIEYKSPMEISAEEERMTSTSEEANEEVHNPFLKDPSHTFDFNHKYELGFGM